MDSRSSRHTSWAIAAFVATATTCTLALLLPELRHWYLLPVTACGILAGVDAVDWARQRLDTFDPQALLGLFGVHFFYAAPILHVALDFWPAYVHPATDWRHALGLMAALNTAGLIVYRAATALPARPSSGRQPTKVDMRRFARIGWLAVGIGTAAFAVEVALLGGPAGFLTTATTGRDALTGFGWLLVVAESFPLLAYLVTLVQQRAFLAAHPTAAAALFALFAVTQFAVGGLRGSRSNTIWPLLIALVATHLLVRPIRRRTLAGCAVVFCLFMYGYGLYKGAGREVAAVRSDRVSAADVSTETGRTLPALLLGDLGRADIQALVLDRQQVAGPGWSWGLTYVSAGMFLLPDRLHPGWTRDKVAAGTDALYGRGVHAAGGRSSRIYGLAGEGLLNFGPLGAVAPFVLLGLLVRWACGRYRQARTDNGLAPKLLAGVACITAILALGSDLDNLLWFTVKTASPLLVVVFLARRASGPHRDQRCGRSPVGHRVRGGQCAGNPRRSLESGGGGGTQRRGQSAVPHRGVVGKRRPDCR